MQLSVPHRKWPMHSLCLSQSPSNNPHGWELEQHAQVSESTSSDPDQSHPPKESVKEENILRAQPTDQFCFLILITEWNAFLYKVKF